MDRVGGERRGPPVPGWRRPRRLVATLIALALLVVAGYVVRVNWWPRPRPVPVIGGVEYHDVGLDRSEYDPQPGCPGPHARVWNVSVDVDHRRWWAYVPPGPAPPDRPGTLFVPDSSAGKRGRAVFRSDGFSVELDEVSMGGNKYVGMTCELS